MPKTMGIEVEDHEGKPEWLDGVLAQDPPVDPNA